VVQAEGKGIGMPGRRTQLEKKGPLRRWKGPGPQLKAKRTGPKVFWQVGSESRAQRNKKKLTEENEPEKSTAEFLGQGLKIPSSRWSKADQGVGTGAQAIGSLRNIYAARKGAIEGKEARKEKEPLCGGEKMKPLGKA